MRLLQSVLTPEPNLGTRPPKYATDISRQYVLVPNFYRDASSLRAQFEWKISRAGAHGNTLMTETSEPKTCRFWAASADRIFPQPAISEFLMFLRKWANKAIGARHASTPEIHVFTRKCWREPYQDATPANWRYAYVLGPTPKSTKVKLSLLPHTPGGRFSFLAFSRTIEADIRFGDFIAYEKALGYRINLSPGRSERPLGGIVLLSGYLW